MSKANYLKFEFGIYLLFGICDLEFLRDSASAVSQVYALHKTNHYKRYEQRCAAVRDKGQWNARYRRQADIHTDIDGCLRQNHGTKTDSKILAKCIFRDRQYFIYAPS